MYTAEDILIERERRIQHQQKLLEQYKIPILVIRVNYPGINKDNYISREIIKIMDEVIYKMFSSSIHYKEKVTGAEGPLIIMCVDESASEIKARVLDIESNHILGRCVDLDVYDDSGSSIGRQDFGLEMRKCYLCQDIAHNCVRSKKHSREEVVGFIESRFEEYMEKSYEK